jgi:opine dehydrogenase
MPGSCGSLVFAKEFWRKGVKTNISETLTLPYGTRKTSERSVHVSTVLKRNMIGALPSNNLDKSLNIFRQFYPDAIPMNNVLEVGLYNPNIILHPAASILSSARIDFTTTKFDLYKEGFSVSVMKVLDALDREIMQIFTTLDMTVLSYKKIFERRYETSFDDLWKGRTVERKGPSTGPFSVQNRYITEDIPIGMVLVASVGRLLGVPTPTFDAIIHLGSLINESDYWNEGRTLEKVGLDNMNIEEIKTYLERGTFS